MDVWGSVAPNARDTRGGYSRRITASRRIPWPVVCFLLGVGAIVAFRIVTSIHAEVRARFDPTFEALEQRSLAPPDDFRTVRNWLAARSSRNVSKLRIEIDPEHLETLRQKRTMARRLQYLFRSEGDVVPATIWHGDREVKARVRLKGDRADHLDSHKWSLRVEVRGGQHVLGMRRFSIQAPKTRFHHHEALFFDHLRREGILTPRYFFAQVELNEQSFGLMAVEEHFATELLESQGRREGVITRYDENDLWRGYQQRRLWLLKDRVRRKGRLPINDYDNWRTARVDPFRSTQVAKSETLGPQSSYATRALRGLAQGVIRPSDIMNVDRVAQMIALCELWSAWHPLRWHNVRLYVDPITTKFEFIAFDGNIDDAAPEGRFVFQERDKMQFVEHLLGDPAVRARYLTYLASYLDDSYLADLETFLSQREEEYLGTLHSEFPRLPRFDFETIRARQKLRRKIGPRAFLAATQKKRSPRSSRLSPPYPAAVYAYRIQDAGGSHLEFVSPLRVPVEIERLWRETEDGGATPVAASGLPVQLAASWPESPSSIVRIPLDDSPEKAAESTVSKAKIRGVAVAAGDRYEFEVSDYPPVLERAPDPRLATLAELESQHPYLIWDGNGLSIAPGRHRVPQALNIPAAIALQHSDGTTRIVSEPPFTLSAGTELNFAEDAYLLTHGPLHLLGTADQPVILSGDGGRSWLGVAVFEASEPSQWRHFEVRNAAQTRDAPLALTGGVTLYRTEISLRDGAIRGSGAEDSLNLVSSRFEIERLSISDAASDGIDVDFSSGSIRHSQFARIGGDGVDLMSSRVELEQSDFEQIGDKAISVGEASDLVAAGLRVRGAGIGVVSKDASSVHVSSLELSQTRIAGLATYIKKPEYADRRPTSIDARKITFDEASPLALAQHGTEVRVDGRSLATSALDVEALYRHQAAQGVNRAHLRPDAPEQVTPTN